MSHSSELALAESSLLLPEADYQIIGRDDRVRVRNTRRVPFRRICKLEFQGGGGCTGTLIASNKVLTAGHCLYRRSSGRARTRVRVVPGKSGPGRSRRAEPFGHAWMRRFDMRPEYRTARSYWAAAPFDYAVITLDRPIGRRTGWFRRIRVLPAARLVRLRLNTSGYPGDRGGHHQYLAYDRVVRARGPFVEYLHDTMPGQSGSAVWVRWRNQRAIVAIHKRQDDPRTPPVANLGVRVTPTVLRDIRRWVSRP